MNLKIIDNPKLYNLNRVKKYFTYARFCTIKNLFFNRLKTISIFFLYNNFMSKFKQKINLKSNLGRFLVISYNS